MNLTTLTLFGVGSVLIYSAVKGQDPRDVVRAALTSQPMPAPKYAANSAAYVPPANTPRPTTDPAPGTTEVTYVPPVYTYRPTTDPAPGATGV